MNTSNRSWFNVREFGAAADGRTNDAPAIQKAIDAACAAGGGTAYLSPGEYYSGSIEMKPNVRLELEAGAVIIGSTHLADYTRPADRGCLIYGQDAPNMSIGGRGRIHGSGMDFVRQRGDAAINTKWRPGNMLTLVRCNNLLIEDITLTDSPSWTIHPIDCDGVVIRGISLINGLTAEDHVPNADGIDPDGCSNVRISDCLVQSGDDSIVLKISKRSQTKVCRDITVTNCICVSTETALKIGSESCGEFRNIAFSNCVIRDAGCGVGLWMRDGGIIDGWVVNNIAMTLPHDGVPIYFTSYPREEGGPQGIVRNVTVSNVTAVGDACVFMSGAKEQPLENITLENFRLFMRGGDREKFHADPPYPFQVWGHRRAPYDIFCRYVNDLALRNIKVTWSRPEKPLWGSAVRCHDVSDLEIAGLDARQSEGSGKPAVWLKDVDGAFLHSCRAPQGTGTFLELAGKCTGVTLTGNDLRRAKAVLAKGAATEPAEVFQDGNRPPE